MKMKTGAYRWDNNTELRTRCTLSLKLYSGHNLFTSGKEPLATATLMPDGTTLDIIIFVDRVSELMVERDKMNKIERDRNAIYEWCEQRKHAVSLARSGMKCDPIIDDTTQTKSGMCSLINRIKRWIKTVF